MIKRWSVLLLWLMVCVLMSPTVIYAHAYIDRSTPQQESELRESPKEIRLSFTEKIDTNLSKATLVDASGKVVAVTQTGEGNRWIILTPAASLANGVYKVEWQILSLDTHVTEGSFRFAVGVELPKIRPAETKSLDDIVSVQEQSKTPIVPPATAKVSKQPVPKSTVETKAVSTQKRESTQTTKGTLAATEKVETGQQQINQGNTNQTTPTEKEGVIKETPADVQILDVEQFIQQKVAQEQHNHHDHSGHNYWDHWLRTIQVMAAFLVGGVIVNRLMFSINEKMPFSHWLSVSMEQVIYFVTAFLFIGTGFTQIVLLAQKLSVDNFGLRIIEMMFSSNVGVMMLIRTVLVCLFLGLSFFSNQKLRWVQMAQACLVVGLVVTFTLTGHTYSGATLGGIPFVSHVLHFIAGLVWVSGLAGITVFTMKLPKSEEAIHFLHSQLKRFSIIAMIFVIMVTMSGVILSVLRVDSWNSLVSTDYGVVLLSKVAVFALALVIAAGHRFYFLPAMDVLQNEGNVLSKEKLVHKLFWFVRAELLVAMIVVMIAGILSSSPLPS